MCFVTLKKSKRTACIFKLLMTEVITNMPVLIRGGKRAGGKRPIKTARGGGVESEFTGHSLCPSSANGTFRLEVMHI